MPELPDVDIFKSYFDSTSLHQNIKEIETEKSRIFKTNTDKLKEIMEGHSFDHTHRTGKYLFTKIKSDGYLLLHFGMTGYLNSSKLPFADIGKVKTIGKVYQHVNISLFFLLVPEVF
jgi:formamidopyrimidine-DNA glycosylase